jgi:hypothetical protein
MDSDSDKVCNDWLKRVSLGLNVFVYLGDLNCLLKKEINMNRSIVEQ